MIVIPSDAIRIRVIANSNSLNDQATKIKVVNAVEMEFKNLISKTASYEEVQSIIKSNISKIGTIVENITQSTDYTIDYGNNYFPEKIFKSVLYVEGNYESIVIKLGKGSGDNWWCVLFPPLCLLDTNTNINNVEYKLLIKEIFNIK